MKISPSSWQQENCPNLSCAGGAAGLGDSTSGAALTDWIARFLTIWLTYDQPIRADMKFLFNKDIPNGGHSFKTT